MQMTPFPKASERSQWSETAEYPPKRMPRAEAQSFS